MSARLVGRLAILSTIAFSPALAADDSAIADLGSRRELFVDDFLIDRLEDVRLVLNRPRDEGPVLHFDEPWEGRFCGYCTVIKDTDRFRLYYRGRPTAGADGDDGEVYCYAESVDGVHWRKPRLGLFEVLGHKINNVVLADAAPVTHNFCPLLDTKPGISSQERFKAVGGTMSSGLIAWVSADGIHWKQLRPEPILAKESVPFPYMFDSQNLVFWSPGEQKYLCYFRVFEDRIRRICRSTSDDFVNWTEPGLMEYRHRDQPAPIEHLYTNQTHPYFRAPHIYLSIAARFMPGRRVLTDEQAASIGVSPRYFRDTSDAVLMTTRGGLVYDRTFLSSFVRPAIGARNWVSRTNYPALNVVQTGPTEMSLYVNQDYAQPTAHLRRYSMRLDGFASARAEFAGGELRTKPFTFSGSRLTINFATSAAGGVRVELVAADTEQPIPGFGLDDCVEQIGNEVARVVSWKNGPDVSALAGRPVRMRLAMKDADLFSFRFAP